MNRPLWLARGGIGAVLILLAAWITLSLTYGGGWYYQSIDGVFFPYRLLHFRETFVNGFFYPRWMAEMYGGYGYPTFVFYPPAFFYLALPFTAFFDILQSTYGAIVLTLLIGISGAYALARLWCVRALALTFAIIFITSRYVSTNLVVLSDFSQLLALCICPWNAYFLLRLGYALRHNQPVIAFAIGIILSSAAVLLAHPLGAFWWFPFAGGLLAVQAFAARSPRMFLAGGLCFLIAAVLTTPYWLTLFQLKSHVSYQHSLQTVGGGVAYTLLSLEKLIAVKSNGWQLPYFAWATFAGLMLGWRQPIIRYTAIMAVGYLFLMTTFSKPIWETVPLLEYTQYSGRLSTALLTILYLGLVQVGPRVMQLCSHHRFCTFMPIALATIAVILTLSIFKLGPFKDPAADFYKNMAKREHQTLFTATSANEFTPLTARPKRLANRYTHTSPPALFMVPTPSGSTLKELPDSTPYRLHLQVNLTGKSGMLINQLWFPGWKVVVNGKSVPINPSEASGRILVSFDRPGRYDVRAWYDGPPGWQWRNGIMVLLIVALLYALWRLLQHNARS